MASRKRGPRPATETCPHCGTSFAAGRLACPECGSDADTGWRSSEDIDYLSLDLPEETAREQQVRHGPVPGKLVPVVVVLVLLGFCLWILRLF